MRGSSPEVSSLRGVSAWLRLFDESWASDRQVAQRESRSADSWQHYQLSYSVDALTAAYRASGDVRYADDALSLVQSVVDTSVPSRDLPRSRWHDGNLGWASLTGEERGDEVPLYESYFWRYATTLFRIVLEPGSTVGADAREKAKRLIAFAERDVFDKWLERGADQNTFRSRTHMASHWALIALNLMALTEHPGTRKVYAGVIYAIDHGFPGRAVSLRQQFVPNPAVPGAILWSDRWGDTNPPRQDVAHGNGVVAFIVEAHDLGIDWGDDDVEALVRTFDTVMWRPGRRPSELVDGSGAGSGWFSDGFVKLGRYSPALQSRLEGYPIANGQFYANCALNAHLLGAPALSIRGGVQDAQVRELSISWSVRVDRVARMTRRLRENDAS